MARVLFFALLAMCLVCLIQGAPAGEQPAAAAAATETSPVDEFIAKTKDFAENLGASVKQAVTDFHNDPHVKQVLEGSKKIAEEFVDRVQTGFQAAIPKTQ